MAIVQKEVKTLECQNHTLEEVVEILKDQRYGAGIHLTPESASRLSRWVKELSDSRNAIYSARVALSKVPA